MLQDESGQLSPAYLERMTARLSSYPFAIKAVFLPKTEGTHLGCYAEQLFKHWQLDETTVLLVVALDRRKIGMHAGKELKLPTQELPFPVPSGSAAASPRPGQAQEPSHLELLPQAVEAATQGEEKPGSPKPSPLGTEEPPGLEGDTETESFAETSEEQTPSRGDIPWIWLAALPLLALLGAGGAWGWKRWLRHKQYKTLQQTYQLNGQVALGELDGDYARVEGLLDQLDRLKGATRETLASFHQHLREQLEAMDAIYAGFDEQLEALGRPKDQAAAVAFFEELEKTARQARELAEQGQEVESRLASLQQRNRRALQQSQVRYQQVLTSMQEIRRLHPRLQLLVLYRLLKQLHQQLQELEQSSAVDPLGLEKSLSAWESSLNALERDLNAIPHLWIQLDQPIRRTIQSIQERLKRQAPSGRAQGLNQEVQALFAKTLKAVEQGDRPTIDPALQALTVKLQELEMLV